MTKLCFINDKNVIETAHGVYLKRPTIYFNYKYDILYKIGEFEKIDDLVKKEQEEYDYIKNELLKGSFDESSKEKDETTVIELTNLPVEMACYVICRAYMYKLSGFLVKFYNEITNNPENIQNWIQNEMNHVKIDLYNK